MNYRQYPVKQNLAHILNNRRQSNDICADFNLNLLRGVLQHFEKQKWFFRSITF